MIENISTLSEAKQQENDWAATISTFETVESEPKSEKNIEYNHECHEAGHGQLPQTPQLPIELWKDVIEYTTYLPGELGITEGKYGGKELGSESDHDSDLIFGRVDLFTTKEKVCPQTCSEDTLQNQLQIRLNLALVSRLWYNLVAPSFYRTLYIRRASQLRALLDRIALEGKVKDEEDTGFGRFVRRIDIDIGDREGVFSHLSSLLDSTPNTLLYTGTIFSTQNTTVGVASSYMDASTVRLPCRLQYLHCGRADGLINPHQQLSDQLSAFTHLRALSIPKTISNLTVLAPPDFIPTFPTAHGHIALPSLEILHLPNSSDAALFVNRYLVTFDLPRLHTLQLEMVTHAPFSLLPFLETYGHQINTLRITDVRNFDAAPFSFQLPGLKQDVMPNLKQLIVNCGVNDELPRGFAGVPGLGGTTPNVVAVPVAGVSVGSAVGGVTGFKSIEVFEVQLPLRNRFLDSDELHVMRPGHDLAFGDVVQWFKRLKVLRVSTSNLAPPVVGPVTAAILKSTSLISSSSFPSSSSCSSSEDGSSSGSIPPSPAINPAALISVPTDDDSGTTSGGSFSISREEESMMKMRYFVNDRLQKFTDLLEKRGVELDNRLFY